MAIGFMIGLQREFAFLSTKRELVAGERTFALMGVVGALAAMIADITASSFAFVAVLMVVGIFLPMVEFMQRIGS